MTTATGAESAERPFANDIEKRMVEPVTEASQVVKNLWVGSAPDPYDRLEAFDVLVFAAEEYQPPKLAFRGQVLRCGIDDDGMRPISAREQRRIVLAARRVVDHLFAGDVVLCTCRMGWNRSSLVAGCALKWSSSLSVDQIVDLIRAARGEDALTNRSFVEFLYAAPAS